jgi:hypothetical protein
MARPTNQQRGIEYASEIMAESVEHMESLLAWSGREKEIAAESFDKARQARLAELNQQIAMLAVSVTKLNLVIEGARRGEYVEI